MLRLQASSFKLPQVGRFAELLVPLIDGQVDEVSRAIPVRKNQKRSMINSMSHLKKYGLHITIKKVKGTKYSHRVVARRRLI